MKIDRFEPTGVGCPDGYFLYGDGSPGPWRAERVHCRHCEAVWVAAWPDGGEPLECPVCRLPKGRPFHE